MYRPQHTNIMTKYKKPYTHNKIIKKQQLDCVHGAIHLFPSSFRFRIDEFAPLSRRLLAGVCVHGAIHLFPSSFRFRIDEFAPLSRRLLAGVIVTAGTPIVGGVTFSDGDKKNIRVYYVIFREVGLVGCIERGFLTILARFFVQFRYVFEEDSRQRRLAMYPWYTRDSVGGQLGQLCGPMATTIKTENGYNDCMLALDYATQSKKAFGWEGAQSGGSPSGPQGGGVGTQGAQGLVHWMSVMAEHMDPAVSHYMSWNQDQCGQHGKDDYPNWTRNTMGINKQGYEAKMNEHQNQMQKGLSNALVQMWRPPYLPMRILLVIISMLETSCFQRHGCPIYAKKFKTLATNFRMKS
ncbi:hypothetical protein QE152_g21729 [Popillia japonica]|uniref:Uncharacterized protein n=1 Tax=Popillia japonica TaxID=7064 RepID=A0AAW1KN63_POPJA